MGFFARLYVFTLFILYNNLQESNWEGWLAKADKRWKAYEMQIIGLWSYKSKKPPKNRAVQVPESGVSLGRPWGKREARCSFLTLRPSPWWQIVSSGASAPTREGFWAVSFCGVALCPGLQHRHFYALFPLLRDFLQWLSSWMAAASPFAFTSFLLCDQFPVV